MGHAAPLIAPDGHWYYPGSHSDGCSCCTVCEILMPGTVARIEAVELSGMALDPTFFRIDNGNRMVWENSKCCFPHCQDMGKKLGDIGTFGITYTPGVVPKEDGLWAAGVLASEFAKACAGGACRLPSSVTSVARQGVSMELASGMFDNGTGIREVDAYIYSLNPNGLKTAPKVWSPDLVRSRHRMSSGS